MEENSSSNVVDSLNIANLRVEDGETVEQLSELVGSLIVFMIEYLVRISPIEILFDLLEVVELAVVIVGGGVSD